MSKNTKNGIKINAQPKGGRCYMMNLNCAGERMFVLRYFSIITFIMRNAQRVLRS